MTNEKAIQLLHRIADCQFDGIHGDERREALSMAVRALEGDGDTISRKMAIDAVAKWFYDVFGIKESDGTVTIFKRLRELPSAQPHWIPCSERLPEANGRYLVTRGLNACGALWNRVYIINYTDLMGLKSERIWWGGNVGKSDFERFDDVIAWMPLPKPYGGESDG